MVDINEVLDDLRTEGQIVEGFLTSLTPTEWQTLTPAAGWSIAHQIGHLLWTDDAARHSLIDSGEFTQIRAAWMAAPEAFVDQAAARLALLEPDDLLYRWRNGRNHLALILRTIGADSRIEWFGPTMRPISMASARLMETWAHGHDIAGTLREEYPAGKSLRHIADLGVRTRAFSYRNRGLAPPEASIAVELTAPNGETWAWGDRRNATSWVRGTAEEFCLAVTQRSHLDELHLDITGEDALDWLQIAQAFAGRPTTTPRKRLA
ncbi:TIGR03084 family protein [Gordonia sp. TBRC 11910]|uniref:TIGR03084 family protein n=1 Tax=Gordonia asplenii TaxID=2725283 RepID=A0A848KVW7_9ACTN|nr:TIGR03084 family metal-binding protein [Gordonia asplenii]NMO02720.1 TIGR03084 family protein [Gordonia asplenii]